MTDSADEYLKEGRTGKNISHKLISLLKQSIYGRLAGYDDTNDADRLSQDPAMRVVVGWKGSDRKAASTSEMSRFETELLTQEDNRKGLDQLNVEWVKRVQVFLSPTSTSIGESIARQARDGGSVPNFHYLAQEPIYCLRKNHHPY